MSMERDAASDDDGIGEPLWKDAWAKRLILLLVFGGLVAGRFSVLTSPPFYDFALGLWREAEYLARTGFDYQSLRNECSTALSEVGGPRSYMVSVMPTLVAVFMRLWPAAPTALVAYHLLVLACGAYLAVTLFGVLRRRIGNVGAGVASLGCLTTPLVSVQLDMAGFEIPLLAAGVAWLAAVARRRFGWALAASVLAFFVKATGALFTFVLGAYLFVLVLVEAWLTRRLPTRHLAWCLACGVVAGGEQLVVAWGGAFEQQQAGRLSLAMALVWFPDVLLLMTACFVTVGLGLWLRKGDQALDNRWMRSWRKDAEVWCSLMVIMLLAVAVAQVRFIPRYGALSVPFVYVVLAQGVYLWRPGAWIHFAWIFIVVANLVNWNGSLFPDQGKGLEYWANVPADLLRREGSLLERSHEFEAVHRENIEALRAVVQRHDGSPVVTSLPECVYLTMPALGLVERPIVTYSFVPVGPERISGIKSLADFERDRPAMFTALRDTTVFSTMMTQAEVLRPTADDEVLYQEPGGYVDLVAYRRRARESESVRHEEWLTRARSLPTRRAVELWSAYHAGGAGGLLVMAEQQRASTPDDADLVLMQASAAARIGRWESLLDSLLNAEARTSILSDRRFGSMIDSSPSSADRLQAGLTHWLHEDRQTARRLMLENALAEAPFFFPVVARYRMALDLLDEGDTRGAGSVFRELLKSVPKFWPAEMGLALAAGYDGNVRIAEEKLTELMEKVPAAEQPLLLWIDLLSTRPDDIPRVVERAKDYLARFPNSPAVAARFERLQGKGKGTP